MRISDWSSDVCSSDLDATMLAMAGLSRLGLLDKATAPLSPDEMLPAVAQGAIGVERRFSDEEAARILVSLHHTETGIRVAAERATRMPVSEIGRAHV